MIFIPKGVCSSKIEVETEGNVIKSVMFYGGCNGNLQGISRLLEGMDIDVAIEKMQGIQCGYKNTSCPDQLAAALRQMKTN